jgi:hypothetical protein
VRHSLPDDGVQTSGPSRKASMAVQTSSAPERSPNPPRAGKDLPDADPGGARATTLAGHRGAM